MTTFRNATKIPVPRFTAARQRELRKRFSGVPFLNLLGMKVAKMSVGTVSLTMPVTKDIQQYMGLVHGGAISTLADTAATFAALTALPDGTDVITIEFKLNFLEPIAKRGVAADAKLIRLGGRTAIAEATVREAGSGTPAAIGLFTMSVLRPK